MVGLTVHTLPRYCQRKLWVSLPNLLVDRWRRLMLWLHLVQKRLRVCSADPALPNQTTTLTVNIASNACTSQQPMGRSEATDAL
jgi:hypothetical protein